MFRLKKSFAKYMALFLAAMFTFSAAGCGKEEAEQQDTAVKNEEKTEEQDVQEETC